MLSMSSTEAATCSSWGTPEVIETNTGNADYHQVSVSSAGDAVAVWQQSDGTRDNIWSNRYVVGDGWGDAQLIETDDSGNASKPQVAVNSAADAVAVWQQSDGTRWNIYSNRYVVGDGWGSAQLIETDDSGNALGPQVAVDDAGNAVAVWYQSNGTRYNICSNRYVVGEGWGTVQLIDTYSLYDSSSPEVAVDGAGNAVVVWKQYDGTFIGLMSNRYVAGTGWGVAQRIDTSIGGIDSHQVSVSSAGDAVAVWQQVNGTRWDIYSNRYVIGDGWGSAQLIETDNSGDAFDPQVAANAVGDAVAVWEQNGNTHRNIWSNRYVVGTGWGTAQLIETDNSGDAYDPQVAANAAGDAVAVWWQSDGTRWNVYSNLYVVGDGWGAAQFVETDDLQNATEPKVAVDGTDNAVTVWRQFDGNQSNIWSNRGAIEEESSELPLIAIGIAIAAVVAVVILVAYVSIRKKLPPKKQQQT